MQYELDKMISNFNQQERQGILNYTKQYMSYANTLTYEDYIKRALVFAPKHKWYIEAFGYTEEVREVWNIIVSDKQRVLELKDFDEIISYMDEIEVEGFGELIKYDTALAIGILLNKLPDKIFIHAGPRDALKYLLGQKYSKCIKRLNNSKDLEYVLLADMPNEFLVFKDELYLAEDCLCYIYSHYVK